MTTSLTIQDVAILRDILTSDSATADRGGFYLAYYEMIKDIDAEAARQVLMQAHISTYSGFFGGAALLGNALAKFANPIEYNISLDEFSFNIADALLQKIEQSVLVNSGTGVFTANQIQGFDAEVWADKGMGDYFPGNYQLWDEDYRNLLTAGTMGAALAGLQLVFGSRIGFEEDQSGTLVQHDDYDVKFDASGKVVWVKEHIGLVDNFVPYSPTGTLDEPTLALIAPFVAAIEAPLAVGLAELPVAYLAYRNDAFSGAVSTMVKKLGSSLLSDATLDVNLRDTIVQYVGADGTGFAPQGSLPSLNWDDFPIIMKNTGSFVDDGQSHILMAFDDAQVSGGAGDELGLAFGNSVINGQDDDDILMGNGTAHLFGDDGSDIVLVRETAVGDGGSGDDTLIAADNAVASGGEGDDWLIGLDHAILNGGDGNDWILHFGSGEADGGDGSDTLVAIVPDVLGPDDVLEMRGGAGDDWVMAFGGDGAKLYGGAGSDWVVGWSGQDRLWGGDGTVAGNGKYADDGAIDYFNISDGAIVMDAQANDYVSWGPLRLTGGVQQWWSESHWAYWAPMSSLVSSLGWLSVTGGGFLTAMAVVFDTPFMLAARYGHDDSGQLLIQLLRGRAGVAAVNNYNIDFDTGEATGNIAVFRISYDGEGSLKELVYWTLKAGTGVEVGTDPLVIDLDGDGIELIRQAGGVYFDIDNDGFAEKAGWVSGDDGLLARDLNGNGLIDNQGELFGNASLSGFAALAALDSNADGVINSLDADFTALRVWRDLDRDGKTDAGELKTLVETGITSISLTTTTPSSSQLAGNPITAQSTVTFANGQSHVIADVILANNQADSVYLGDSTVSSAAAALANLKGFGNVKNLDMAMTGDAALLALVDSFKDLPATTSWAAFKAAADDVLFRWAGVDGVSPVAMTGGFDRQKLAFLEKIVVVQLVPQAIAIAELIETSNNMLNGVTIRLAVEEQKFNPVSASNDNNMNFIEGIAA